MSDVGFGAFEQFVKSVAPQMVGNQTRGQVFRGAPVIPEIPSVPSGSGNHGMTAEEYAAQHAVKDAGVGDIFKSGLDTGLDFLKSVGSNAANILKGGLYVVSTPRSVVQSTLKEFVDLVASNPTAAKYGLPYLDMIPGVPVKKMKFDEPSWGQWWQQIKDQPGAQELFLGKMKGGWQKAGLGFVLDVAQDPLTYVGGKLFTATGEVADVALNAAIKSGSAKLIAKNLSAKAAKLSAEGVPGFAKNAMGEFTDDALNKFLVDVYSRGAGSLTKRGIARAGLSDDVVRALGLPSLNVRVSGIGVRGTRALANVTEDFKGAIKSYIKNVPAAKALRIKFTPQVVGRQQFMRILLDESQTMGRRAAAAVANAGTNEPLIFARSWGRNTFDRGKQKILGAGVHKLDEAARIQITRDIENGVSNANADIFRGEFDLMRTDLVDNQVDVGDLGPNYVPHQVTEDARRLGQKNQDVAELLEKTLNTKEGFQKYRGLRAGDPFLGSPLEFGTIEEINGRFEAAYGVKLFEDDITKILPKYIKQATDSMARAKQIEVLTRFGFVSEQASRIVSRLRNEEEGIIPIRNEIAANERKLAKAAENEKIQLSNGVVLRRGAIKRIRSKIQSLRSKVQHDLVVAQHELMNLAREDVAYRDAADAAQRQIDDLVQQREMWFGIAESERGAAKAAAEKRVKRIDDLLKIHEQELRDLNDQIAGIIGPRKKVRGPIKAMVDPLKARRAAVEAKIAALGGTRDNLTQQIDELSSHITATGATNQLTDLNKRLVSLENEIAGINQDIAVVQASGRGNIDAAVQQLEEQKNRLIAEYDAVQQSIDDVSNIIPQLTDATRVAVEPIGSYKRINAISDQIDNLIAERDALIEQANAAALAYVLAEARSEQLVIYLSRQKSDLDRAWNAVIDLPREQRAVTQVLVDDYKTRMSTLQEVMSRVDNSIAEREIAAVEIAAAKHDAEAILANDAQREFEGILRALEDSKFIDVVQRDVAQHMHAIGTNHQMPDWLFEATKTPFVLNNLPVSTKFVRDYYNLFKGYAIFRPGFGVRNAYSGMFNMYLEAGPKSLASAIEFKKFFKIVRKNPVEDDYMRIAIEKFGEAKARRLKEAWDVTLGTGSGQAAGEFTVNALTGGTWNPLSAEFKPLRFQRGTNEYIENIIRGAHAYDALKRGHSIEAAMDIVNTWQFNYLDITSFDQRMKLVNPFWIFYSRNLALQASTWTKTLGRLNRSIVNFKRNIGYGRPEDELVPSYFEKSGAIRISDRNYWFPDLPQFQFWQDVQNLTSPDDWNKALANLGPWFKIPIEVATNKSLFSGGSLKNKFSPLFGSFGGPIVEERYAQALQSAIPGLGQTRRLFPESSMGGDAGLSWLSFLTGIGIRQTDERTRRYEALRQRDEARNAALKAAAEQKYNG